MSTFQELYTEVLAYGFDATAYTTRVKAWINEAQSRIARTVEVRELFTTSTVATVAGTVSYTLPADFIRINGLTNGTYGLELRPIIDIDALLAENMGTTNSGSPSYYSLGPSGLYLSPCPDAVYSLTMTYYKNPVALSANGDISTLPVNYHDLMVSYALSKAYRSEDDPQQSQFYYAEYARDLAQMRADRQYEIADSPRVIPGTWGVL